MPEFTGITAIVTGGGSGIGLATALLLAAQGATVAVIDRVADVPPPLRPFRIDVTDRAAVEATLATIGAEHGRIDIVVNHRVIHALGGVGDHGEDEWRRVFETSLMSLVHVSASAIPWLRESPRATIINVCSNASQRGLSERAVASAFHGAILSLSRSMATDLVRDGVRVNCVTHGPVIYEPFAPPPDPSTSPAAQDGPRPVSQLVTADEVARAIVYLASPFAGSTTGTSLDVGGSETHRRTRPKHASEIDDTVSPQSGERNRP